MNGSVKFSVMYRNRSYMSLIRENRFDDLRSGNCDIFIKRMLAYFGVLNRTADNGKHGLPLEVPAMKG